MGNSVTLYGIEFADEDFVGDEGFGYLDEIDVAGDSYRRFLAMFRAAQLEFAEREEVARENVLINGNFDVWTRGSSSATATSGSNNFLADRFFVNPGGANITQQRSTTVRSGARSLYSLQLDGASSVTTVNIGQRIEQANTAKISAGSVSFGAWVYNGTGAAFTPSLLLGTPSSADNFASVTNRLTQALQSCPDGAWTRVSHTADISGYTNIGNGLQVELQIPTGVLVNSKTVRLAELLLVPGSSLPEFHTKLLSRERRDCERYCEKSFAAATAPAQSAGVAGAVWTPQVVGSSASQSGVWVNYKTRKRAAGTVTLYNPNAANAEARNASVGDCSSTAAAQLGETGFRLAFTTHGSSAAGQPVAIHYLVDSEL